MARWELVLGDRVLPPHADPQAGSEPAPVLRLCPPASDSDLTLSRCVLGPGAGRGMGTEQHHRAPHRAGLQGVQGLPWASLAPSPPGQWRPRLTLGHGTAIW